MVQYRDLNAPPPRLLADVVADMKAQERQSKTGDAGVKDLGETGDVVWPRPDGTPVSVRDVDLDLADARQRIEDAETSLSETGTRLTAAEQAVQDVRDDLAAIEVGEGGPLIHDHIPAPADGEGKPAGTAWLVYGQDGTLTSVWQWDGTVWEEMPLDATLIPVLDIGSGTFGDLEGSRLTVNDLLAARVVQAMDLETKKLVVTEEAILNHATLIGQTVVDDINVQGKLIGTDGVFTGTVDFANVNVTGELLANEISGEHIYGTVIEGGTFTGGEFLTSEELPGRVRLADDAFYGGPGLEVRPPGADGRAALPGIGPNPDGMTISGGDTADGDRTYIYTSPEQTAVVAEAAGRATGQIGVNSRTGNAWIQSFMSDGQSFRVGSVMNEVSLIHYNADGTERGAVFASLSKVGLAVNSPDGTRRRLETTDDGVWVRTNESGSWQSISLIPQVRPFQYSALWNADLSPAPIMVQHLPGGKLCQAQIRIQNLTGSSLALPNETWVKLNYNPIPSDLRGGFTDYIEVTLPQLSARGRIEMNYSTGSIRIRNISGTDIAWTNNNSIWFPMRWFSPN